MLSAGFCTTAGAALKAGAADAATVGAAGCSKTLERVPGGGGSSGPRAPDGGGGKIGGVEVRDALPAAANCGERARMGAGGVFEAFANAASKLVLAAATDGAGAIKASRGKA